MSLDLPASHALSAPRLRYDIVAVCVALAIAILGFDLAAPMGIASEALYVTVVILSLLADNARITWFTASGLTVMTCTGMAVGYLLHMPGSHEAPWIELVNRAVSLMLIWLTASMGVRSLQMKRQVVEHGLELHRMNIELNKIARHDALTGVANRRYFDERLNQELARAVREKADLSLMMIDIDFFKKYNDLNGHQAGDACIIQVAQTIQASLRRPADMVARYGGEEFAVILPVTNTTGALHLAEAIRKKVETVQIEHPGSHKNTSVTVSIGLASVVPGDISATSHKLIFAADAALYQVKQSGRNGVKVGE